MSQFNLIDEPWIPVRFLDGRRDSLGIRETLYQAKGIDVIEDPSPLVVAGLYRFLLAVLYRALEGPCDIDEARILFENGLPLERIDTYLKKWRDRFWLFDDKFPFGQVPEFTPKVWRTWTTLAAENNADNAKVLFDHVSIEDSGTIPAHEAARRILATMTFSVSAGKSELSHTGTAPSATAVIVIPQGNNLSDTLLFSLAPQPKELFDKDSAIWERTPETVDALRKGIERPVTGFADRYTWPTRSTLLFSSESSCVEKLAFASGVKFVDTDQKDPMVPYREDKKIGILPIQFKERGLWRDFDSLLPDASGIAPKVIEHAARLSGSHPGRFPTTVLVLGQSNDKAKINFWRLERFALPQALTGRGDVRYRIRKLLDEAEMAQRSLWKCCKSYAVDILTRSSGRSPADVDVTNIIRQMPVLDRYWSILESSFHDVLRNYTIDKEEEAIEREWLIAIRDAMRTAWDEHRRTVEISDAWAIRACVKAEGVLGKKYKELAQTIKELEP